MWVIKKFGFAVVMGLLAWLFAVVALHVVVALVAWLGIPCVALTAALMFGIVCFLI